MKQPQPTKSRQILDYMLDRESCWIDTFTLERLGGRRSWRTRVSDARRMARLLGRNIINRQRRRRIGKRTWTTSEYSLVKTSRRKAA